VPSILAVVALFGAGLAASVSPCVLPLMPGVIAVLAAGSSRSSRLVGMAAFAAASASVFVALGLSIGVAGAASGWSPEQLQRAAGVVLVMMGVALFGVDRGWWSLPQRHVATLPTSHAGRGLVLGAGCAVAWTPCVGPLLGAALTTAGTSGNPARAAMLLVAFTVGVLLPFVAVAALRAPRVHPSVSRMGALAHRWSSVFLVVLGATLAAGWYDELVLRAGGLA
jgi:cytochrome c-type biogenesis protein